MTRVMTLKETWRFIESQPGSYFKWTFDAAANGWQPRPKTDAECYESQKVYGDLVRTHQDSLPIK